MKTDIDKKIEFFANQKNIAVKADNLLSKLISAKSPVIIDWLQKRDLLSQSEEQIAKAWRLYYAQNFILGKYPQEDSQINSEVEALVDGLLLEYFTEKFKAHLEKIFGEAKNIAIETLKSFNLPEGTEIIKRVSSIVLYWPKSLKSARNNSIPLDLVSWGIAYDPIPNEINIGLEALAYPDDKTYLAVFAHEIGHSFDSCRWGAFFTGTWPFEKVGQCLRSEQSVGALKRDDSQLETLFKSGKLKSDLIAALKANPTCNKLVYPPIGVQADQLPESFADWFSAEVLSRLPKLGEASIRLDLCEEKELVKGSSYPSHQKRRERIYLVQPAIKAAFKDSASMGGKYCSLRGN